MVGRFRVYGNARDYCRRFVDHFDVMDKSDTRPFMTAKAVPRN